MKMSFVVCNEFFTDRVMQLLKENGIDYFTSWERAADRIRLFQLPLDRIV